MTSEFDLLKVNIVMTYNLISILEVMNQKKMFPNKTITEIYNKSRFRDILKDIESPREIKNDTK